MSLCRGTTLLKFRCKRLTKSSDCGTLCWQHEQQVKKAQEVKIETKTKTKTKTKNKKENKKKGKTQTKADSEIKVGAVEVRDEECDITFKVKDKLVLGDPGNDLPKDKSKEDRDIEIVTVVKNCRPGYWKASWKVQDFGTETRPDERVLQVAAQHTKMSESDRLGPWLNYPLGIFGVGVDSGMAGIFDYYQYPREDSYDTESSLSPLYEKCTKVKNALCFQEGVVTHSGFGDGMYNAKYKKDKDGKVVGVKIIFIDEKEQAYWNKMTKEKKKLKK